MLKRDFAGVLELESGAVVERLDRLPDLEAALVRFSSLPHCLFLDSARRDPKLGRYSFLTADPFEYFQLPADGSDGLAMLGDRMHGLTSASIPGLPPFQGGAAGLLGYDLARSLERLST